MTIAWSFSRDTDRVLGQKRQHLSLASLGLQNKMYHGEVDEASMSLVSENLCGVSYQGLAFNVTHTYCKHIG